MGVITKTRVVTLISAIVVDAEGDIEAPYALTANEKVLLAVAEKVALRVVASAEVGAASFTIDSISGSYNGTDYRVIQSFAPVSVTANGELQMPEITEPILGYSHLRLDVTVTTLDGSNKITITATLQVVAMRN
jgi:hypothetical protein